MSKRTFLDAVNGYESTSREGTADTGKRFFVRTVSGTVTQKKKKLSSLGPVRLMEWLSRLISYTSTKAYGAAMLAFGLLTIILHFAKDFIGAMTPVTDTELIVGIVFSVISVPLLLFDRPMCIALQDFPLTDLILFEFLCIKRMHRMERQSSVPTVLAILIGSIPAAIGYFIPTENVVFAIVALSVIYVAFISPECSLFASFIILPYVSYLPNEGFIIPAIIVVTVLSLLRKVVFGKRYLNLEQYDVLIGLMMIFILISGIFVKGLESFIASLGMVVLMLGYILCSNLVSNRRLADRAVNAIIISSLPAFAASMHEFFTAVSAGNLAKVLERGISGSFGDPAEYAAFLVVILTLTVAEIKQSHGGLRAFYVILFLVNLFATVLTAQRFALVVLLIGFVAYFSLKLRALAALLLPVLFIIPYAIILLVPSDILNTVLGSTLGGLSADGLISLWERVIEVIGRNLWVGIGIGADSFSEEFGSLIAGRITDSHNVFLELVLEAGVPALVCFVIILLIRLRHRAVYSRYTKNSQVATLSPIISVAILVLLTFGATNYIWSDISTAYLFWSVLGLGSATLRIAKREHDDRVLYYDGASSSSFSVIDIELV